MRGHTYSPKSRQRARTTGFRRRMKRAPHIIKARRLKGRVRLTAV